jgi:hypothetical protein
VRAVGGRAAALFALALLWGTGAQAYRATDDARIAEEVTQQLAHGWLEEGAGVLVLVRDGIVELFGVVYTEEHWAEAERLAERTPGVDRVVNHLTLANPDERPVPLRHAGQRNPRIYLADSEERLLPSEHEPQARAERSSD